MYQENLQESTSNLLNKMHPFVQEPEQLALHYLLIQSNHRLKLNDWNYKINQAYLLDFLNGRCMTFSTKKKRKERKKGKQIFHCYSQKQFRIIKHGCVHFKNLKELAK